MATEIFTTIHTAGLGNAVVIARFFDATQGAGVNLYTFDFDDNSWETTLANATTPNSDTTEKTDAGDVSVSAYSTAAINLANFNNTATPMKILVQFVDTTGTDTVINEREIVVVKGEIVEQSNLTHILGTLLSETSTGYLTVAFKKLFDVASPVLTVASVDQTGDSYAIVNSGTHGNAQLVRSTTPANTFDVSASGEGGLDFDNIKDATGATTLTNITVPTVTDVTNRVTADVTYIHGSALTESTGGYLAAAFVKLFDVASPLLVASDVMRGTDGANTTVPDAATTAAGLHTTTDALIGGLNDLSQANIRTAVGLASANLDTQLADLPTVAEFGARTLVAASYFVVGNYTTPPTVGEIDTELTSTHGADAWTSATGTGDASDAKQTLILEDLADIKGTSFAKDTDSLVDLAHTGADSDTLETLSDQIDTWGTGITVSRTTTGTAPTVNIDVGQYEAFSVALTASDAQTGDSHELTAYKANNKKTAVFRYTTANGDISVGGSGDTVITISADNTNMKTARQLQYVLWNTTDSEKVCEGVIDIEAHPEPL